MNADSLRPGRLRGATPRSAIALLSVGLLTAACGRPAAERALFGGGGGSDADTGDALGGDALPGMGCVEDAGAFGAISVAPVEQARTVLRVRWDGVAQEDASVVFIDALGHARAVPAEPGEGALLVGNRAADDVALRIVAGLDGERVCTPPMLARTGDLPAGLPEGEVSAPGGGPETPAFLALPVLTDGGRRAMVFETRTGAPVWHWTLPASATNESPIYRLAFRRDGRGVLLNVHDEDDGWGGLFRVDWDGSWTFLQVPGASRDFTELPDGTIAVLASEVRETESGLVIRGDRLIELSPGGERVEVWNMFDDFPHDWGETVVLEPQGPRPFTEWAHANGLTFDAASGDYVISLPDVGRIVRVERASGALVWALGDDGGDFDTRGVPGRAVEMPHSVQLLDDDRLLVFNRRGPSTCSSVLELELDVERGQATRAWEHASDDCLFVGFLGEGRRLPDGDTVVDWSSAGRLDIVGPEGTLRWRLALDLGAGFGFVDHAEALGIRVR